MRGITKVITGAVLAVGVFFAFNAVYSPVDARDYSSNAVIKGGTYSLDELRNAYNSDQPAGTQNIFSYFKLNSQVINSAPVKDGYVTKSGEVVVNGQVVANNALTAGRQYIAGSTKQVVGGTTFYTRAPSVSFRSSQISAYVFFDAEGRFVGAVLKDCGNPVSAANTVTPPSYACDQLTAAPIDRYTYSFTPRATGSNGATLVNYTYNFGDGKTETHPGAVTHAYTSYGTFTVTVTANFSVNGATVPATSPACQTTVELTPPDISYVCENLTATKISSTEYKFTAKERHGEGAVFKNYSFDFGDGGAVTTQTQPTINHTYAPGTYTATVTANYVVNGKPVASTNNNCKVAITVEQPKNPAIEVAKTVNGKEHDTVQVNKPFTYEITVTNTGNIDLKNVVVSDPAPQGVTFQSVEADKGTISNGTWTYTIPELKMGAAQAQAFKITAIATKQMPQPNKNTVCVDAPEIPGQQDDCDDATIDTKIEACNTETGVIEPVVPGKENTAPHTTDLTKCDDVKVCDTETGTVITVPKADQHKPGYADKDSAECKETPPTPPTQLPQTGIADAFSGVLGLGSMTAAGYYYLASRRNG